MLGSTAIIQGGFYLNQPDNSPVLVWIAGMIALVGGGFLIIGFMTPLVALIIFLGSIGTAVSNFPAAGHNLLEPVLSAFYVSITALAIVLLGPGAFSLDARMFGRREIIIPDKLNSPKA